jgi:hypothetical protein
MGEVIAALEDEPDEEGEIAALIERIEGEREWVSSIWSATGRSDAGQRGRGAIRRCCTETNRHKRPTRSRHPTRGDSVASAAATHRRSLLGGHIHEYEAAAA